MVVHVIGKLLEQVSTSNVAQVEVKIRWEKLWHSETGFRLEPLLTKGVWSKNGPIRKHHFQPSLART